MHFEVDAIVHVTSVPVARGEQFAGLFRRFRPRASRPCRKPNQAWWISTSIKILLFLCRKPHRRPGIPVAKIRHRLRSRVPKSSSGAQVETPQRVAPQAGFFYRRGRE